MADTAPPLTEADPLSEWIARIVFAFPSGDSRRDDIRVLAARALTLESDLAQLRAFIRHVADGGSIVSTAAMTPTQIAVARAAERMFVTQDGLGFAYVPGPPTALMPRRSKKEAGELSRGGKRKNNARGA